MILVYIVINHGTEATAQDAKLQLLEEITRVEELIKSNNKTLAQQQKTVAEQIDETLLSQEDAARLIAMIRDLEQEIELAKRDNLSREKKIKNLEDDNEKLKEEKTRLEEDEAARSSETGRAGEGQRQYMTGLKMSGQHVLILLDASASMFHISWINAVRYKNSMDTKTKLQAEKWQRALEIVDYLLAVLRRGATRDSNLQVATFNSTAELVSPPDDGDTEWIRATEFEEVTAVMNKLRQKIPEGGTSLYRAFELATNLSPKPDNIFLITDSLPTIGSELGNNQWITSQEREVLFNESKDKLLESTETILPVNIILLPMEGDPGAAFHFWDLAQKTQGGFIVPDETWP